jgi:general secretion pathway protein G
MPTNPLPTRRDRRGLTLVELLVAAAIVAALSALAIPGYIGYLERSRSKQAVLDIRTLEMQIERFRIEFGRLPGTLDAALDPVPQDPWGSPYVYLNLQSGAPGINGKRRRDRSLNPINSDYDLYSRGPDGESKPQLNAKHARDDIVRANDGAFVGTAEDY